MNKRKRLKTLRKKIYSIHFINISLWTGNQYHSMRDTHQSLKFFASTFQSCLSLQMNRCSPLFDHKHLSSQTQVCANKMDSFFILPHWPFFLLFIYFYRQRITPPYYEVPFQYDITSNKLRNNKCRFLIQSFLQF